jgi:hypothetical protein
VEADEAGGLRNRLRKRVRMRLSLLLRSVCYGDQTVVSRRLHLGPVLNGTLTPPAYSISEWLSDTTSRSSIEFHPPNPEAPPGASRTKWTWASSPVVKRGSERLALFAYRRGRRGPVLLVSPGASRTKWTRASSPVVKKVESNLCRASSTKLTPKLATKLVLPPAAAAPVARALRARAGDDERSDTHPRTHTPTHQPTTA